MNSNKWKNVNGYDGIYVVSDSGVVAMRSNTDRKIPINFDKNGYAMVSLKKDGKYKTHRLNRIVAKAFIENPYGLPYVSYINGDNSDNRIKNLEWTDKRGLSEKRVKTIYERKYKRRDRNILKQPNRKEVVQLDLCGNVVARYDSIQDAARNVGIGASKISEVCRGDRYSAAGFLWSFLSDCELGVVFQDESMSFAQSTISKWMRGICDLSIDDIINRLSVVVRASEIYFGIEEEWVPVCGYDNYLVSNFGRMKSLDRYVERHDGIKMFKKGGLMRPSLKGGYLSCSVSEGNVSKTKTIHRWVMESFNRGADFSLEVNHIDFNKMNNYVENLEFCSKSENLIHMWKHTKRNNNRKFYGRSVVCLDTNGDRVRVYDSINEASRAVGINPSVIRNACVNMGNRAGGFRWEFQQ